MALWTGTDVEGARKEFREHPATALAYALGNVELRVFQVFGCEPEDADVPDEAREVALVLLQAIMFGGDLEAINAKCEAIISKWRDRIKGSVN